MQRYWHWGTGIVVAYIVFASGTLGFAVYAMRQRVDLVSDDYYAQALQQDRHRAAVEAGEALRDRVAVTWLDAPRAIRIGLPLDPRPAGGSIRLYRPADAAGDRDIALDLDADGRQTVDASTLASGRWIVQIDWTAGGRERYVERSVMLP